MSDPDLRQPQTSRPRSSMNVKGENRENGSSATQKLSILGSI